MPICQRCILAIKEVFPQGIGTTHTQDAKTHLPILTKIDLHSCWICLKFSKWLESEFPDAFKGWKTKSLGVTFFHYASVGSSNRTNAPLRLFVGIGPACKKFDDDDFCVIDLALLSPRDYTKRNAAKHDNPLPGSFNFPQVKEWIDTCRKSHKQCNQKIDNWYPTRLLQVTSGGKKARLIISQDDAPKGHYITISYRWAKVEYTKLLNSTMAQLQRNVTIPKLPPAVQDAIKIAASLDIQYLWADCVCIKQDDRLDWEIEARTMGKVYANGFLNISATSAVNGSESLFYNQGYGILSASDIEFKVGGKLKQFSLLDGDIWTDEIPNAPLNSRGWVFQERFLARRVLHFSARQLGWECRQLTALEMFPRGLPTSIGISWAKSSHHAHFVKIGRHTRRSSVQDWLAMWQNIVERYSQCRFTDEADRLTAFAGIGGHISDFVGTEIVAGMLEKSLIFDLAWLREIDDRERSPLEDTSLRAPSWSWMSVQGQIIFPKYMPARQVTTFIENIEIIRDDGDPYDINSRLRLRGVCMELSLDWSEEDIISFSLIELPSCDFVVEAGSRGSSMDYEIALEQMHDLGKRGRVLLLPLFLTPYSLHGILITSIGGSGLYRRIGAVSIPTVDQLVNETEMVEENTPMDRWRRNTTMTTTDLTTFFDYMAVQLVVYIQGAVCQDIEIL